MSIYLSSPSLMRSVFVDFTFAMISQDVLVMMPFPEKVNPKTALFSTYSPTVINNTYKLHSHDQLLTVLNNFDRLQFSLF